MQDRVVFTSKETLPSRFLYGFAFSGADVVVGDNGYSEFARSRRNSINPGDDGGFFVINKSGSTFKIGTDFGGYTKIFYFSDGRNWAFSNSFTDLADAVKAHSWRMELDGIGTASLFVDGSLGEQPLFHRTPIKYIRLLPRNKLIKIDQCGDSKEFQICDIPTPSALVEHGADYFDLLKDYLDVWSGRFCSMFNSDLHLICDVTGGLDSRAVYAQLLRAAELSGANLQDKVYLYSNTKAQRDFVVSVDIAEHYGLKINDPKMQYFPRLDPKASYETWQSKYLYGSWPIRFPGFGRSSGQLWMCGNGGESHRWARWRSGLKPVDNIDQLFARQKNRFADEAFYEAARQELQSDSAMLGEDPLQPNNSVVRYYRNFRERFHHGRRAETINSVAPLSDSKLTAFSRLLEIPGLRSQRAFADIIHNSAADLNTLPMKSTSYTIYAGREPDRLKTIEKSARDVDMNGRVFGNLERASEGRFDFRETFELMAHDHRLAAEPAQSLGLATVQSLNASQELMDATRKLGRFEYPVDAKPLATTILAGKIANWL